MTDRLLAIAHVLAARAPEGQDPQASVRIQFNAGEFQEFQAALAEASAAAEAPEVPATPDPAPVKASPKAKPGPDTSLI